MRHELGGLRGPKADILKYLIMSTKVPKGLLISGPPSSGKKSLIEWVRIKDGAF